MTAKLKSLRQRVWPAEQRELGEAVRDIHGFCQQLTRCEVASATNVVWAEPFSLPLAQRPLIVLLADARVAGTLQSVDIGALDWTFDVQSSGAYRVRINRAATLQSGKSYDLKFLVVY
jgi:hypothetical protein